ncbi:MAG: YiiD C-terminal domain-containing protein [Wenzhouxiangella sp.]|jgi:thioesterase domain-containing protein|nr:YiiD C-terminal domain-containing protein [Wenzhouxiangella sp.]
MMFNPDTIDLEAERAWLEPLLRERIPLAEKMDLRIARLDATGIQLDFPLAPSINDKGTAFGGALASAMILAGWSLPRLLLKRQATAADLVIGRCELHFVKPVQGPYSAQCNWPEPEAQRHFLQRLDERGKGRLDINARILTDFEVAASLQARYAALTANHG